MKLRVDFAFGQWIKAAVGSSSHGSACLWIARRWQASASARRKNRWLLHERLVKACVEPLGAFLRLFHIDFRQQFVQCLVLIFRGTFRFVQIVNGKSWKS